MGLQRFWPASPLPAPKIEITTLLVLQEIFLLVVVVLFGAVSTSKENTFPDHPTGSGARLNIAFSI